MKAILSLLTNRWLLSSLGLAALSGAIWLVGPELRLFGMAPLESASARLIAILTAILLWVVNQLRKVLRASKANKGMVEGLIDAEAAAAPDRSTEEVEALKRRFEEAVAVLRKAKGKSGRLSLYDLPWYIIIGPPGSGKTTALVNSGLEFPLAERFGREALGGIGGTRNCDWWFTDQAILLDTAGRYTLQDSDANVDRAAWEGFLGLLKKYRRRRPINGVIVAISLLDLMVSSESERLAHAHAIRSRIQELDRYFQIRFPVYVLLTKCDLVAGFIEFFDDLARHEREQVWGVTFPIELSESTEGAAGNFGAELDALLERLNARLLWRLSQEQDPRRRAAIYGFPSQIASLKHTLESFLGNVFRGSRFEQAPLLRGVYFTSGTQEGTPIDRLMGAVARSFGLDPHALAALGGRGRSYFIKSVLTDIVFGESELAGTNRRLETQRAWLQRAAYAGSAALVVAAIFGWSVSFMRNSALIERVEASAAEAAAAIQSVPDRPDDLLAVLPALDAVRSIADAYAEGGGLFAGLGLSQGKKLARQVDLAYRRALTEMLLPRLTARLEQQLRAVGSPPELQYEILKVYLMLDSPEHYNADEVIGWFDFDLRSALTHAGAAERDRLLAHVAALFDERPAPLPVPLDQALIEQTQRIVARIPPEERLYNRLKRGASRAGLDPFTVVRAAGTRSRVVFARRSGAGLDEGIDGLFTRDGYRRFFLTESGARVNELIDESWILGSYAPPDLNSAELMERVRRLYLDEFVREYDALLADLRLAPFTTAEEASSVLKELSDPVSSPLLLLLRGIAAELELETGASQGTAITRRTEAVRRELTELFGGGEAPAAPSAESMLEQRLGWVRAMVGAEDPGTAAIGAVRALFDELYQFMTLVMAERGPRGDVPPNVERQFRVVVQKIITEANRQPPLIAALMRDAAERSQTLVFSGVRAHLNAEWRSEAYEFCRQAIAGRYPIDPTSAQEIRLADFARFFGPGGLVDSFFQQYLDEFVDRSRSQWSLRSSATVPVQISADALAQFQRAAAIREAFFRAGATMPQVTFELRPVRMDDSIDQFTLEVAGKRITYSFGPLVTEHVEWPGPDPNAEVRIEMTPMSADGSSMLREQGAWAWFRVLGRADVRPSDRPETYLVEFRLGQRSALYELVAQSSRNPFRLPELTQFRCPESL